MIHAIEIHYRRRAAFFGLPCRFIPEVVMVGKLDQMLHFQETALSLRAQRQQLLASNIANADTPNYKARDIDFNKALEGALKRSNSSAAAPGELQKTAISHLAANVSQTI